MILIEDKTDRQNSFYKGKNLLNYNDILYNAIDEEYNKVFKELKSKQFNFSYNVMAVHESAFGRDKNKIIEYIKDECEKLNKKLIFFSGGIINTTYQKDPEILDLNEDIFYENLELFLKNIKEDNDNLLILGYGDGWEINVLDDVYEKIVKFLQTFNENQETFRKFKREIQLDKVSKFINVNEIEIVNRKITKDSVENLKNDIYDLIIQKMETL